MENHISRSIIERQQFMPKAESFPDLTRKRYNRIAFLYDLMEAPMERLRFASWRQQLTGRIKGRKALEVGVGTGKNLIFYPDDVHITAIDLSPRMLERARKRANKLNLNVNLQEMDVQHLNFADDSFDTVFATFVFCSVPDPVAGLPELRRVCKPGGELLLIRHMRPKNFVLGLIFDLLNPMIGRMMGANINRRKINILKLFIIFNISAGSTPAASTSLCLERSVKRRLPPRRPSERSRAIPF
jgi:ubiquinone/menaquinone biosynthesis C-methylase UbiE